MTTTLLLDPDIRDWVVMPLFVIMIVAGLLRHYVGVLLQGEKKPLPVMAQRGQNLLSQTNKIRSSSSHYLTTWQWHVRKQHYAKMLREQADWMEDQDNESSSDDPMEAMMANPMGMMKGNMAFMVQK